MTNLILYNIFINYFVALISLLTFIKIFRSRKKDLSDLAFGLFWLFMVGINGFEGLRLNLVFLGYTSVDQTIYYINQFFVHLHIIALGFYIVYKVTRKIFWASFMAGYAVIMTSLMYFYMVRDGFTGPHITFYGTEWGLPSVAQTLFHIVFATGMIFFIYDLFYRLYKYSRTKNKEQLFALITTIAIIIYASFGFFDELGIARNVNLIIVRIGMVIAPLICYLVYVYRDEYFLYRDNLKDKNS